MSTSTADFEVASRDASAAPPDPKRFRALGVIAIAQLMIVLDASVVTIALPSAQPTRTVPGGAADDAQTSRPVRGPKGLEFLGNPLGP